MKKNNWEIEFRQKYEGANVWSSKSSDDVISTIQQILTQQNQELLAEVRGIVGEDEPRVEIEPRETFTQRMAKATYQNALRSELRTKLNELEKSV